MRLGALVRARAACGFDLSWTAVFIRSYARVARRMPELRRAYFNLPWPHLYEYPASVATFPVERECDGEREVLFARVKEPERRTLVEMSARVRGFQRVPVGECKLFRRLRRLAAVPLPARRLLWWLGLNLSGLRARNFGTFSVTAYSALGAASLHPLTVAATTLTYGVIEPGGEVPVRVVYDHRVLDGATVARALAALEEELLGATVAELRGQGRSLRLVA
jgi:hypothetical protein